MAFALVSEVGYDPDGMTAWRPPGSPPLRDMQASERVRDSGELRPGNRTPNHTVPSSAQLEAFQGARYEVGRHAGSLASDVIPHQRHVTGGYSGTTDEILQWAAHKWGIPADLLRAVAVQESRWVQAARGDRRVVENASAYPRQARISNTEVQESMGIMQIKWRPDGSLNPGTEPLRWKSTAFNVDFYGALVRFFYDGAARSWFGADTSYEAGQESESLGAWYQPSPWRNDEQLAYVERVRRHLAARTWERPGF